MIRIGGGPGKRVPVPGPRALEPDADGLRSPAWHRDQIEDACRNDAQENLEIAFGFQTR